jgi:hypothetical protein
VYTDEAALVVGGGGGEAKAVRANPGWLRYYLRNERYLGGRVDMGSWVWLSVSIVLNSLSLLSIAEQHSPTGSSLTVFIGTYRSAFTTLTTGDPLFPPWVKEAFVIMGGVFAAANYFVLKADGANILNRLLFVNRNKPSMEKYWSITYRIIILYAFGIFIFLFLSARNLLRGRRFARVMDIAFEPARVVRYYCFLLAINLGLQTVFRYVGV